ncbi:MAG: hypothetical protein NVV73_07280 [Cellvibrionaceae bacterium]|nr:hypothetical protein [Cellvibrionaceae bacterium]
MSASTIRFIIALSLIVFGRASADTTSVNTGIANSGTMNIEGDISIEVNIISKTDDLVSVLNLRAENIIERLKSGNDKRSEEVLAAFMKLHERHIQLLKEGNLVAAHEVLVKIHRLSYDYETTDLLSGLKSYLCSRTKYIRGAIINAYIVNQFKENTERYELSGSELIKNARRSDSGCGVYYEMAAVAGVEHAYRLILDSK